MTIPDRSLVILIGTSGSGKTTFARRHFKPTEVVSSDFCRALVADDENDQGATPDAFEVLHLIVEKRLARGRLTVIDATNVQLTARRPLLALAREHEREVIAIVFDLPEDLVQKRHRARRDRDFDPRIISEQYQSLRSSLEGLSNEGFHSIFILSSPAEVEAAEMATHFV
jgi:predicted kinase